MSRREWKQIWSIFEQTAELPAEERAAFLTLHCGEDHIARQTVEELLAADVANSPFDEPLLRLAPLGEPADTRPQRIGPYRTVRELGQGGMSTVYLAVRDDDAFARLVVIKVVRRGMESEQMLSRLRSERRILASLEHPHIARLYDGGTTPDGMPYFVLEHIDGVAIDAYCDDNRLTIDERLVLFLDICEAVRYAHQNLVVHRDIKPSNILVAADGKPKLLDFGIAKLLHPALVASDLDPTATWHRIMTPSYASPEQVKGLPITTASDVYSLGVLLYKLLTGRVPHALNDRSVEEIERVLSEDEPVRPSAAVTAAQEARAATETTAASWEIAAHRGSRPGELSRRLAGDLDAIVLKALRTTPRERYGSAEAFAADIEHHRAGLPVDARRGTWRYRSGKFLRRHRAATAVAAVVTLLVVVFGLALARQATRIAGERAVAVLERDRKDQVMALLLEIFDAADPYVLPGRSLSARDALVRGKDLISHRLEGQPAVRAQLLFATGSLAGRLGDAETAIHHLEQALEIYRELHPGPHLDHARTLQALAAAHKNLRSQRSLDIALERAEEAVAMVQDLPDVADRHLLEALVELLSVYCNRNEHQRAEAHARRVMELIDSAPAEAPIRIAAYEWVALIRSNTGDYASAIELSRHGLALGRKLYGEYHPGHVPPLNNLALTLRHAGAFEAAERTYGEALAILDASFPDGHPASVVLVENIAGSLHGRGEHAAALERYDEAQILARAAGDRYRELRIELRKARPRIDLGHGVAVEHDVRRTLDRLRALGSIGADHWLFAEGTGLIGASLLARGSPDEAEPLLLESFHGLLGGRARQRYLVEALERLRRLYEARGEPERIDPFAALLEEES